MSRRRYPKPEPGYVPPKQRAMRTVLWFIVMVAAALVFYAMVRWQFPT